MYKSSIQSTEREREREGKKVLWEKQEREIYITKRTKQIIITTTAASTGRSIKEETMGLF